MTTTSTKPPKASKPKAASKNDFSVMETNSSSIVSKRSVERLYFKGRAEYFRYFVRKLVRRSPTINRGYWLRMYALEYAVRRFLREEYEGGGRRVVVNLGCGFDPLPFQLLSEPKTAESLLFVDVDYPELIEKKLEIIRANEPLQAATGTLQQGPGAIRAQNDRYLAVGCNLTELDKLQKALEDAGLAGLPLLFMAEVSITYMERPDADKVVEFTARFPDARFALMEQIMPEGPEHPFADTMLKHFNSISSPIKSVPHYQTLASQVERFKSRGWKSARVCDLGEFWERHVPADVRRSLDEVEPFDEWEEFYLFAQHYFLLLASTKGDYADGVDEPAPLADKPDPTTNEAEELALTSTGVNFRRKFGAAARVGKSKASYIYTGGLGNTRESSSVLLTADASAELVPDGQTKPLKARMCHSMTTLRDGSVLLSGGRGPPQDSFADTWTRKVGGQGSSSWEADGPLPESRYRHSQVALADGSTLIYGGKSENRQVLGSFLLRNKEGKLIALETRTADQVPARFGAILITSQSDKSGVSGMLAGGIDQNGVILDDIWTWNISSANSNCISLFPCQWPDADSRLYLARFGAEVVPGFRENSRIVIGGIAKHGLMARGSEVVEVDMRHETIKPIHLAYSTGCQQRPMLIGISCVRTDDSILVFGGGSICFSFGPYWNKHILEIAPEGKALSRNTQWILKQESVPKTIINPLNQIQIPTQEGVPTAEPKKIPRVRISTAGDFDAVVANRQPVIIEGIDIGSCVEKWTPEYLCESIGNERKVVVHVSNEQHMNFQTKNFSYETMPFSEFISKAFTPTSTSSVYLRSVSTDAPSSTPANLSNDFPSLAPDFQIPPFLSRITSNQHSSPLRISSANVGMWLHYDVMANILCHIRGTKRFRLYPASDILHLSFPTGATTSTIPNVFDPSAAPPGTSPYEIDLQPGDVLYIPELWPHAALPLTPCIAVNVFFRNLGEGTYAAGKDVYGNRDIAAYENGRKALGRIEREFKGLPEAVRRFYLERLGMEMLDMARKS